MNTISDIPRTVQPIPSDSDGLIVPRLIPVAAYLCVEGYCSPARSRVLERLADGDSPAGCVAAGALEPADAAEVERLLGLASGSQWSVVSGQWSGNAAGGRPAAGGSFTDHCPLTTDHSPQDEWPRLKSADERRAELAEVCRSLRETAYP